LDLYSILALKIYGKNAVSNSSEKREI
jgi:hypothetical protein